MAQLIQGPHSDLAQVMSRYSMEGPKQYLLHQVAWALANDSAYTTLSLTLSPIQVPPHFSHFSTNCVDSWLRVCWNWRWSGRKLKTFR